ncbi:MAG: hypothetical protein ACRDUY_05105 [Nitriliruptorales bacterium]
MPELVVTPPTPERFGVTATFGFEVVEADTKTFAVVLDAEQLSSPAAVAVHGGPEAAGRVLTIDPHVGEVAVHLDVDAALTPDGRSQASRHRDEW